MGVETWLLLATVALLAWAYSRWRHSYWASRGVPSPPALPFIGHFHKAIFFNFKLHKFYDENFNKFYSSSMCGVYEFFKPVLIIWDTETVKHVLVKDFDHFSNRRDFDFDTKNERDQVIMEFLTLKKGAEWKSLRAFMSPTFTSGKIKSMFPLVCEKADILVEFSMRKAAENPYVDMKRNFGRYTMDTIASCAFGIECHAQVDEQDAFTRELQAFFTPTPMAIVKGLFFTLIPGLLKLLKISLNPPETDYFINIVRQTVATRQAGQKRGDFLDLMLEARDNPESKYVLSEQALIAQSIIFLIAGFESTSSLLAFSSFLLAKHKDQQKRLRDEVRQVVADHGGITYQGIMEAKLLDAILQESLRLYPPTMFAERSCSKTYKLPGTNLTLQPGDLIQVPVWSLHHDPHHWPNPEAFIPDRFLPENKGDVHSLFMPFGIGPRNCIAMRFALMEAKVALSKLLLEAELEVASSHEEVVLETHMGVLRSAGGLMLVLKPIRAE